VSRLATLFARVPAPVRGALWMMGCTASWSVMAAITRQLADDIHIAQIVFFRSLFGTAFLLPWLFRTGLEGLRTERVGMHAARGILGLITIYILFIAITLAPLGEVAAIMTTRPMVASLAAIVILREAALGRRWTATALGFVGALVILRPGMIELSDGVALALTSVFLMAGISLVMKSLARTEAPDTIAMWQMVIFTPLTLIPALLVWTTPSPFQLVLLVATGFFGTMTQRSLTRAYAAADATVVLPLDATRLVFSALLGLILFAEFPDGWTWAGGAIIFAATCFFVRAEARAQALKP
jgi:drug/metabolite transporter (DMT)-like permease